MAAARTAASVRTRRGVARVDADRAGRAIRDPRDNSPTPQCPTPNERPTPNAQDSQGKKGSWESCFLSWAFWPLGVGGSLGVGHCGVEELTPVTLRRKPRIGITAGDPAGIGPEISIKAAADPRVLDVCAPILYGPHTEDAL